MRVSRILKVLIISVAAAVGLGLCKTPRLLAGPGKPMKSATGVMF